PHYNDRSGTVWNTPETIDTYAHPNNNVLELKLNSQDVPYVLHTAGYTDTVASRGNAHVSRRLGESSWDRQNVYLGSTYGNGGEGSMAIDLATDAVYVTLSDDGPMGTSPDGLVYAIWPADMTVPVLAPTSIHPSPGTDSSWPWLVFTRAGGGPLAVTTFELATNQPRAIRIAG
ncbi:MAG TPA: hypothetical protein VEI97_13280, partial [bacterium]|nr:hypothetical protein [bacterium]